MGSRFAVFIGWMLAACAVPTLLAQRGGPPPGPPPVPRAAAPFDLTGYWVSLVTEDWRQRMFTPPKGDYLSVPLNAAGKAKADTWDPAKDEAAGEQCRAYGAAGVMRLPTRLHITWQDDTTLKLETDAGTQTRLLHFGSPAGEAGSWQGVSVASWDAPQSPVPPSFFLAITGGNLANPAVSLKVVTTRLHPGYLRKNGVPYGANTVLTEYFDRFDLSGAAALLVVAQEVVDPENLQTAFWTSSHFKRQTDGSGWNPTPCAAR
jgi:hypothetical protein